MRADVAGWLVFGLAVKLGVVGVYLTYSSAGLGPLFIAEGVVALIVATALGLVHETTKSKVVRS